MTAQHDLRAIRRAKLRSSLVPKAVLVPSFVVMLVFFYGFILWTVYISLTNSRMLPRYEFAGFFQYITLFFEQDRWLIAMRNLGIFSGLFILISVVVGLLLAILLDQRVRGERIFQTVYLYPMALSFIVTGTVWKWILNPSLGIEKLVRAIGFSGFEFRWLVDTRMAIYTIVIAAVWQASGYIMSLFLAGLRGIDTSIPEAAKIDGASLVRVYWNVLVPMLRPVFLSSIIILTHLSIKSFDLVVVLTQGGPGISTDMPATFMYDFAFKYDRLALGAASSVVMFLMVMAITIPYMLHELKGTRNAA